MSSSWAAGSPDRPACDGWPLHVLENAGHFMVAEPPEAFLEAPRAALGNR
jgi:hypothetical protein